MPINIFKERKKFVNCMENNRECLLHVDDYGSWWKGYAGCCWCGIFEKCKEENPINNIKKEKEENNMNRAKYVVIKSYACPDTMFIFNGWFSHDKFISNFDISKEKILSAGFVDLNKKVCFGKSNSLNIGSRADDTRLLKILFPKEEE